MDNKYTTYNLEELAGDDLFIQWVRYNKNDHDWSTWINQHPEAAETIQQARKLVESLHFNHYKISNDQKEKMWKHIDENTASSLSGTTNIRKMMTWISSAAAILILGWMIFGPTGLEEVYVPPRETYALTLPDASSVRINADSRISYDKDDFTNKRVINLVGEAFFEVEKGSKFTVDLDGSSVEVMGTSFNIFNRKDSISVHCFTGKVRVSSIDHAVILTPGEMVSFAKSSVQFEDKVFEMKNDKPQWIDGVYAYENQSLIPIIEEIERQYDVNIQYDPSLLSSIRFNGTIENRMSLETVLESICWPFKLEFAIKGQQVTISQ